jgi:uncharacterized protein (TIGR03437 family)
MNRGIKIVLRIGFGAVLATSCCLAETSPSSLQVDVNNFVLYNYDTFDTMQFGMNPNQTSVMMKTYNYHISIGDIFAVGGTPAKGTLLCTHTMFVLSPTAAVSSMKAIADTSRSMVDDCSLEILTSAGIAVGTIFIHGLFGGAPPPGAPAALARSNMIVAGGTGTFLGARGQAGQTGPWTPRVASVTEDPANRRVNGGGTESIVLQLFPIFHPEIVITAGGPAVVHSSDFSLVSATKPAKAGEILSLFANGLGPTNPSVDFGQPFPAGTSRVVTSPIEVTVNGNSAEVLFAGGYPGAMDAYQVNFRVPPGTLSGTASLGLTAGFVAGSAVNIPVQ